MTRFRISWDGGVWTIETDDGVHHPLPRMPEVLDVWLAERDLTRRELDFGGSRALEQKFIHDFGPITRRPANS